MGPFVHKSRKASPVAGTSMYLVVRYHVSLSPTASRAKVKAHSAADSGHVSADPVPGPILLSYIAISHEIPEISCTSIRLPPVRDAYCFGTGNRRNLLSQMAWRIANAEPWLRTEDNRAAGPDPSMRHVPPVRHRPCSVAHAGRQCYEYDGR